MAELWPDTLPQLLNVQGHSYNFGDPSIRSNPSVGPSKIRPRSSAVSSPLSGQMYMTTEQVSTLRDFYQVAVRGSDVFSFPDPEAYMPGPITWPLPTVNCRFTGAPTISATVKPGCWMVALPMEIVP